ncbi:MAG: thiamine pyrophosphate-dependent dehydrogenase E1 component subunit alpha [Halobacteriales archaeon]|nr:thiamine pyrophosphate-dependent dehydrogenase E1 component subunit alpha [Halobacteriales archaeon]
MYSDRPEPPSSEPVRVLDVDGRPLPGATVPDLSEDRLLAMYEDLRLARRFDERAVNLQRQGRIASYAPMAGQDGSQVASSHALADADWLFPTYREHAAKHVHGVELSSILSPLMGHRVGYAVPDDVNVMPEYIPVGTQVPQAAGMAWSFRLRELDDRAVLCHLGDGATSEGDVHEGLTFAGVFDLPAVFLCNNNGYAISTPLSRQTASETLAGKAAGYGIDGVRVDGMDPLAVYQIVSEALSKAKAPIDGEPRPTLVESVQYRYGAHTTADDPSRYRDDDEVERWRERDPLDRLEAYLEHEGLLDDDLASGIGDRVERRVVAAVEAAESVESPVEQLVDHVYAEPPARLREQYAAVAARRGSRGEVGR